MEKGEDYEIREVLPTDPVGRFKGGSEENQPLKAFLKNQAIDFHNSSVAKTYVAVSTVDSSLNIHGFITLICSEIDIRNGYTVEDCPYARRYENLPAVKIARLATDARCRGKGVGKDLVSLAVAIAKEEIAAVVGCRFLITDSKQGAITFYQDQGFTMLDTEENRANATPIMFMDLNTLEEA